MVRIRQLIAILFLVQVSFAVELGLEQSTTEGLKFFSLGLFEKKPRLMLNTNTLKSYKPKEIGEYNIKNLDDFSGKIKVLNRIYRAKKMTKELISKKDPSFFKEPYPHATYIKLNDLKVYPDDIDYKRLLSILNYVHSLAKTERVNTIQLKKKSYFYNLIEFKNGKKLKNKRFVTENHCRAKSATLDCPISKLGVITINL